MESDVSRRLDRVLHRLQDFVESFDFDFDFDSLTPDEAIELWGSFDPNRTASEVPRDPVGKSARGRRRAGWLGGGGRMRVESLGDARPSFAGGDRK